MKQLIFISLATIGFMAASQVCGCGSCETKAATPSELEYTIGDKKTVTLKITGMTCGGCANHVSMALSKVDGIISEDISYPGDKNTITYDQKKTSEKDIIAAIEKTGYKAEVITDKVNKAEDLKS